MLSKGEAGGGIHQAMRRKFRQIHWRAYRSHGRGRTQVLQGIAYICVTAPWYGQPQSSLNAVGFTMRGDRLIHPKFKEARRQRTDVGAI